MTDDEKLIPNPQVADHLELDEQSVTFVERLWVDFRQYAEKEFVKNFRCMKTHHERFWEMYLFFVLRQEQHHVERLFQPKGGRRGPDYLVTKDGQKVWIEAIAPNAGKGKDAVPTTPVNGGGIHSVPDREITLRLTAAIRSKRTLRMISLLWRSIWLRAWRGRD